MSYLHSIILGLIQGASEFLPISSSGHLALAQNWLDLDLSDSSLLVFDILLHVGTLVSVMIVFGKDILGVVVAFFKMLGEFLTSGKVDMQKSEYRKLTLMLIIASLPLFVGAFIEHYIEAAFSSTLLVGCALLITGVLLLLTDRFKNTNKTLQNAKYKDALVVGLSQLVAIFPGLSRSGTTIFGGVAMGLSREFAVRFSFLLSSIAILGATAFSVKDLSRGTVVVPWGPAMAGMFVSAIVGIFAIKWLIRLVSKEKFSLLAFYCFAIGLIAIFTSIF